MLEKIREAVKGKARQKHSPRVQELEAQLQAMHDKADRYKQGLAREREAHGQTEAELVEERRFAFKAFCRLAKRLLRGKIENVSIEYSGFGCCRVQLDLMLTEGEAKALADTVWGTKERDLLDRDKLYRALNEGIERGQIKDLTDAARLVLDMPGEDE